MMFQERQVKKEGNSRDCEEEGDKLNNSFLLLNLPGELDVLILYCQINKPSKKTNKQARLMEEIGVRRKRQSKKRPQVK